MNRMIAFLVFTREFRYIVLVFSSIFYVGSFNALADIPDSIEPIYPDISFQNFSNTVTLKKDAEDYLVVGSNLKVRVSNRLVVKLKKGVTREQLTSFSSLILGVKELFSGSSFSYYLVETKDIFSMTLLLREFNKIPSVLLVQPDILQLEKLLKKNDQVVPAVVNSTRLTRQKEAVKERRKKRQALEKDKNLSPYLSILPIKELWQVTRGKGVNIAIIDDGFNLQHAEFKHIKPIFSYDAESAKMTSNPLYDVDQHGTKVMGIIFSAHDSLGIDGIAPEAKLIALRQPDSLLSNTVMSFQLAKLAGASIINCSWTTHLLLQPIEDVVNELAHYGRDGHGIAVIFSAGNDGREIQPGSTEASIESAIVVSAYNKEFELLKMSNYGEFVDSSNFGGTAQTTLVSGQLGVFSGTSLASSITTGIAALILSQNPVISLAELSEEIKKITGKQNNNNKIEGKRRNPIE